MKINNGFYSGFILTFSYYFYQDQKNYNRLKLQYGQSLDRYRNKANNK